MDANLTPIRRFLLWVVGQAGSVRLWIKAIRARNTRLRNERQRVMTRPSVGSSRKTETLVMVQHDGHDSPLFKVDETPNQVLVVIRLEGGGEHLTLHRQKDGSILKTYWSSTKPRGTWDAAKVAIARKLWYRDPDRHGNYFFHLPLVGVQGMNGHELVGRRVRLEATMALKARDQQLPRVTIESPTNEVMVYIHLSTHDHPYVPGDSPRVSTALGDIYFRVSDRAVHD